MTSPGLSLYEMYCYANARVEFYFHQIELHSARRPLDKKNAEALGKEGDALEKALSSWRDKRRCLAMLIEHEIAQLDKEAAHAK